VKFAHRRMRTKAKAGHARMGRPGQVYTSTARSDQYAYICVYLVCQTVDIYSMCQCGK